MHHRAYETRGDSFTVFLNLRAVISKEIAIFYMNKFYKFYTDEIIPQVGEQLAC